jgi:site-specific DNA recombinase
VPSSASGPPVSPPGNHRLQIVGEYVELGRSGTNVQGRPEYQAMMQRVSHQRDVDYIMVYQLSRLNRNRTDDAMVMLEMEAAGAKLLSATENIDETPAGQLTRGILASINQYRSASEGEDIARKLAHKVRASGTIGPAPLGYLNTKEDVDGRMVSTVVVDQPRADLIRQGFEFYASGNYSLKQLARKMADLGLTPRTTRRHPDAKAVSSNKWHTMLRNPYYTGVVTDKGQTYPGRHEGIIPLALFDRVQDVLVERAAPTRRDLEHFHYLKKLLYCGRCLEQGRTSRLIFTQAKGTGGTFSYFFCTRRQSGGCGLRYIPSWKIEEDVADYHYRVALPETFLAEVTTLVEACLAEEQASVRQLHAALQKKLTALDAQEERLIDLAADGTLPQAKIRTRLNKLLADRLRLTQDLADSSRQVRLGADAILAAIELLRDVPKLYVDQSDQVRGIINDALFRRIYIDEAGVSEAQFRPEIGELVDAADATDGVSAHATRRPDLSVETPRTTASLSDLLVRTRESSLTSSNKALMAEDAGFEPARALTQPAFQASAIGH